MAEIVSAESEPTTPLQDLIARAAAADQDVVTSQRNRALIRDMAVALVAQARLIVDLQNAERPNIILPGS